ncbi:MAG: UDP-N-acetylmuramate--L-alanine ligase [Deltaproteobacteria bacterium]|nr:UDP-N-acetylmuramate--L-alanine ligase [Deltaproteobacteria bacterium]
MSGIAEVLRSSGFAVSGSDVRESDVTRRLESLGARISVGHDAANLGAADVVVYSSAVRRDNPELVAARARGIPVIPRAEMLAELMRLKHGIAVAGSHGKTTTTSLIATVLTAAGVAPTVVIGGKLNALGTSASVGGGDLLVAEADESDGSFLHLTPTLAVVTNIDPEHLDHFGTLEALMDAFAEFVNKVPFYGLAVLCLDHPNVQDLLPRIEKRVVTYGLSAQADYRARAPVIEGLTSRFEVIRRGQSIGTFEVRMPGIHNVLNCLAVLAVSDELGVPHDVVREALATFRGVARRFTVIGEESGITVVDDYGHHPEEIRATLEAAMRAYGRRLVVAFQPHRYTRTRALYDDFSRAFNRADVLLLADIYAASEEPIEGIDSAALAESIRLHGHRDVTYVGSRGAMADAVLARVRPGDVVITLGAGDITRTGPEIIERLRKPDAEMERGSGTP